MPTTSVLFYQENADNVPVLEWLQELKRKNMKGFLSCAARIDRLATYGHELRRPVADYLRDGIYELRAKHRNVQYRIFYYFEGQNVVVLSHAIVKKTSAVPKKDIDLAIKRKEKFERDPKQHTYIEE
ncbi:MAG: type II toxin-antitoxin system RelE/ParE family toxin [Cyanobacteria bacterium]|nr:type II toxin-antitoxin system RelE/ParE family toxin [Cyanobacteria bacterium GSL.Bin21]